MSVPSVSSQVNWSGSKPTGIRKPRQGSRQTTLDTFLRRQCSAEALLVAAGCSNEASSTALVRPLLRESSVASLVSLHTLPPPYPLSVRLDDNHLVRSKITKEAVRIGLENETRADRIQLNVAPLVAKALAPVLGVENGASTLALSNVSPEQILAVRTAFLLPLMTNLSKPKTPKMRVKWWNAKGELATERLLTYKDDTRGVSPATALVLVMRAQGDRTAARRLSLLAPSVVAKQLKRLGANDYIEADNIRDVLGDAAFLIADPSSEGTERIVAENTAQAVADYLHQQSPRKPQVREDTLVALLAACDEVQSAKTLGALVGVLLSGLFKYIDGLENEQRQVFRVVKTASTIGLSFLEAAPGGKIAATLISLALDVAVETIQDKTVKSLREAACHFVVDRIKFPLLKTGYLPGMDRDKLDPFNDEQIGSFFRWMDVALETNGYGVGRGS